MKKSTEKLIFIVIVLLIILGVVGLAIRYFYPETNWFLSSHHMYGGMNFGMGVLGMGIFWVLIIGVVLYYLFNQNKNDGYSSMEKLKSRLANGEISVEEYEKIKNKIKE